MIATDGGIFGKKAFIFCGFSDDDVGALSEFVTQAGGKRCRNADGCVLLLIAFLIIWCFLLSSRLVVLLLHMILNE